MRIFNKDTELSKFFPLTSSLLEKAPCTLAFFSIFKPHTKLDPHVGVYKGVIRYHLPVSIPDQWDKCFINVKGRVLNWRVGKDLIFDDSFIHYAENNTDQERVVLFLDIKRDFKNPILNLINTIMLYFITGNDALTETVNKANVLLQKE